MKKLAVFLCLMSITSLAWSKTIVLTNGDRVTGEVVSQDDQQIVIDSALMGHVLIKAENIQETIDPSKQVKVEPKQEAASSKEEPKKKESLWKRNVSLGITKTGGNTDNGKLSGSLTAKRQLLGNTLSLKLDSYYASENKTMTELKHFGELSYGNRFGDKDKWEGLYKFEASHDRFANIDYRIIPSIGLGYWFKDEEKFKLMGETSLGYQYTSFRNAADSEGEAIIVSKAMLEREMFEELKFKQEFTFYPSLEDFENYRIKSETSISQPITDVLSWKLSLIDEYENLPTANTEHNDYRLIAGIDYAF